MHTTTLQLQTTFLTFLLPCFLFGQPSESRPAAPKIPKLSAGLQVGMSFSDINSNTIAFPFTEIDLGQLDRKTNVNLKIGVPVLVHIGKDYSLESGIFYEKRGVKATGAYDLLTDTYKVDDNYTTQFSYEYLTIPVLFKRNLALKGKTSASFHAGPYFSFLQSANYIFTTIGLQPNPGGGFTETFKEGSIRLDNYSRKVDIGIQFQLGVQRQVSEWTTLYGGAFYSKGLTRIDDFENQSNGEVADGKHQVFGLLIGGYFRML